MTAHLPSAGTESRLLTRDFLALTVNDFVGDADHPATIWRLALPQQVRIFGWWGVRRPDPAEPATDLVPVPCVAWCSARGWATSPVRRLPGGPGWELAGWGERVHMVASAVRQVVGPAGTLRDLIGEVITAEPGRCGPGPDGALVGPAVWGLLRLLPARTRLDIELAMTSVFPPLPLELRGVEDGGVWEALEGGAEREIVDGVR